MSNRKSTSMRKSDTKVSQNYHKRDGYSLQVEKKWRVKETDIRNVSINDLDQLTEIRIKAFGYPISMRSMQKSIIKGWLLGKNNLNLVIFTPKGKIVGYIITSVSKDTGHILSLARNPRYARKRYGEKLFKTTLKKLKKNKIKRVFLEVRVNNTPAINLYKKLGFKQFGGVIKEYYDIGKVRDAYRMELDLKDYYGD